MDHPLIDLISARIAEAERNGEFDNLPGAGKPPFVAMARELERLRAELRDTGDRTRRTDIMKEMSMMEARIEVARKSWSR